MDRGQRNRGFQCDVEEVTETDDESEGSDGASPSLGRSKVIACGPAFVRFLSNLLAAPIELACFLSLGAVGGMSGPSLSVSIADARRADMLIASSECRPR